jgi:hypothetical protein
MRRLLAALAVLLSLSAAASAQLQISPEQPRRQTPVGADWKALLNGRMHFYLFGTIDRPLERRAFRVFRPDGTYRVQEIHDPSKGVDGRWFLQSGGLCQQAHSNTYCYGFERRADGWEQRSNDAHRFLVFIPDDLPPDIRLPD